MRGGTLSVLVGGAAGQGLQTIGELLAKCLVRTGYSIVVHQTYHSRVRGGHNTYAVRFGAQEVLAPEEAIDILVALNDETASIHQSELAPGGVVLADSETKARGDSLIRVPFKELGRARVANVAALGVLGQMLCMDKQMVAGIIEARFGEKSEALAEENRQALEKSYQWAEKNAKKFCSVPAPASAGPRLLMNGNDALALGALSAGLKYYAFYPMTPSTPIGQTLAKYAWQMGVVVEQMEDEIAVINSALGASYAGAPAMCGTAGGGFSLMVESVSLAAMTETPIVIVVGMRPAPATGLPTRTEQADLEFVIHAGHGEFPKAVFAPANPEQAFECARKALQLAEEYQSPVFILTDQFLADSYRAVQPFMLEGLKAVEPWNNRAPAAIPYKRFQFTDSGVSPRLLPGNPQHLVVVDSDEHYEDGHITEDYAVRKRMVEKRLRKYDGIRGQAVAPEFSGDNETELLLVCWGSNRGAVLEAAAEARSSNHARAAVLHFSQVWPLVQDQFLERLKSAKTAVCIENNATGQFSRLIRRETGFIFPHEIHRWDGLTMTPEFILRELKRLEVLNA